MDPLGGPAIRGWDDRHVRGAQGRRRDRGRAVRPAAAARGRRRLDGPARLMDGIAQRPLEVELKYRMTGVAAGERLLAADELAGLHAHGPAVDVLQEDR